MFASSLTHLEHRESLSYIMKQLYVMYFHWSGPQAVCAQTEVCIMTKKTVQNRIILIAGLR